MIFALFGIVAIFAVTVFTSKSASLFFDCVRRPLFDISDGHVFSVCNANSTDTVQTPVPAKRKLVIAGVGHRFIAQPAAVKKQIMSILRQFVDNYSVEVRLCFGFGADQLIAECAAELGLTLKAFLPLEREAFIADVRQDAVTCGHVFTDSDERRMRRLLAQTVACETVADSVRKYEAASKYIVDNCDVLLAVWDGVETPLYDSDGNPINRGGTFDTISYAESLGKRICIVNCERN